MENIAVGTTVTDILPEGNRGCDVVIQNQSDTTLRIAIGNENVAKLTAALGIILEPGDAMTVTGRSASLRIAAIHGSTGTKTAHYQLV